MMRYALQALGLSASLVFLSACGLTTVHETVHQSVPSVAAPTVRISNAVGGVKVRAWDKPVVDIVAVKDAHSREDLQHIAIDVKSTTAGVTITTASGGAWGSGVGYVITVPAGASLDIDNGTGGVEIVGVRGDVAVQSTTGGVAADLGTVGGKRNVDMRVTTGGIAVKIARNSSATVDMHSAVGGVANAFGNDRIGDGTARIHLETTVGGVALKPTD